MCCWLCNAVAVSAAPSKHCGKQALPQTSAAASERCCTSKLCCKQALLQARRLPLLLLLQVRAPLPPRSCDLRRYTTPSRAQRTTKKKEGDLLVVAALLAQRVSRIASYIALLPVGACSCCLLPRQLDAAAAAVLQVGTAARMCSARWVPQKCCRCCKCFF